MNDLLEKLKRECIKALNSKNTTPLTEENLKISEAFHNKYYDEMYDKKVKVILKDGTEVIGFYNDEFYEICSIFVNYEMIQISNIEKMILLEEESNRGV